MSGTVNTEQNEARRQPRPKLEMSSDHQVVRERYNPENPDTPISFEAKPDPLALWLHGEFIETANLRYQQEAHWLAVHARLKNRAPKQKEEGVKAGSKANIRILRTRVQQVTTRMVDMLFQGNKNPWDVDETENPQLPEHLLHEAVLKRVREDFASLYGDVMAMSDPELLALAKSGEMPELEKIPVWQEALNQEQIPPELAPPPDTIDEIVLTAARERSKRMERNISDQANEGKAQRQCRHAIKSGNSFGVGWARGPFTRTTTYKSFRLDEESGRMVAVREELQMPEYDYRPVWDIYPYPHGVPELDALLGVFDRSAKSKKQMLELRDVDGYDDEAIVEYLKLFPDGDVGWTYHWEQRREQMTPGSTGQYHRRGMYELIEYDGYLDAELLKNHYESKLTEQTTDEEMSKLAETLAKLESDISHRVQISWLGHRIIRVELLPWSRKVPVALHYNFELDDSSISGESVSDLGDDADRLFQASTRAYVNDIGKAGNAWAINLHSMHADDIDHSNQIVDGKVFRYEGTGFEKQFNPIQQIQIPTNATVYLQGMQVAKEMMNESTGMPTIAAGQADGSSEQTKGGLSMLMQQANIVLKEPVHNFREGFLVPMLQGYFEWNNLYGEEEAKGDMAIKVNDVKALLAKESQHMILENIAVATANPLDAPHINRNELNKARFQAAELDPSIYVKKQKTVDDEAKAREEQMAQNQMPGADQPGASDVGAMG